MRRTVITAIATLTIGLTWVGSAAGYTGHRATAAQRTAMLGSNAQTGMCKGYRQSGFRAVVYRAAGSTYSWGLMVCSYPDTDPVVVVFVHESGAEFLSFDTPQEKLVSWLPFTWGSSPFDDPSYLTHQWRTQWAFQAGPPNWLALARALN